MAEQNKPDDGFNWAYYLVFVLIIYIIGRAFGCDDDRTIQRMIDTGNYYH